MTATYDGLEFKTRLEARWAAFFDLAGWKWNVNPCPVGNWSPDFRVIFDCSHSECSGSHTLLVAVLPISRLDECVSHPCLRHAYRIGDEYKGPGSSADAGAIFGNSPKITQWEFSHGAGGGTFDVDFFVEQADDLWAKAKNFVS